LELWLQFHEQHHVWRALRDIARAVPDKGSWDGECTRGSRESYLWYHSADYRRLYELGDAGAYLCFCFSIFITVVEANNSRIIQFPVKEFLTCANIAMAMGRISRFQVHLAPAHIIVAQAWLEIFLWQAMLPITGRTMPSLGT
jgi:hypothetical protein